MLEKFARLYDSVNSNLVERSDVIKGSIVAMLAQKHVFLIGPPGVAKSLAIEHLCRAISDNGDENGIKYFRKLMDRFGKPEDLFGPYSIAGLKEDRYERKWEGYLPSAHIAFLDECWKASGSILNTLLTIMNERIFDNGMITVRTPLISLFGASNELPEDSSLNALYDRFILRYEVKDIVDDDNFKSMLLTAGNEITSAMTLDDLKQAQTLVKDVELNGIVDTLAMLRGRLKSEGFWFTPRRWKESVDVLKAYAWFHGRSEVTMEDFEILTHIFWDKPEDQKKVSKTILSMANPDVKVALEILDKAQEIKDNAIKAGNSAAGTEANDKFKRLLGQLNGLKANQKIQEVTANVKDMRREVLSTCLGFGEM
jgi:MoxR-like ATPase